MTPSPVHPRPGAGEGGFILPLVLVTVAIVALALWSAVSVLDMATRNVRNLREAVSLDIAAASIEAQLSYVIAVEPLGPAALRIDGQRVTSEQLIGLSGINPLDFVRRPEMELMLDGRRYRLPDTPDWPQGLPPGLTVSLQDKAGLVNLNTVGEESINRLVSALDIAPRRARRLAATLSDYIDLDIFRRLEGAEKDVYEREGLPPPPDAPIRAPYEAFSALGWAEAFPLVDRPALLAVSYADPRGVAINVNTAPPHALKAWFGIDDRQVELALKQREIEPFLDMAGFTITIGMPVPYFELNTYTQPGNAVRIGVESRGAQCRMRHVWITHAQLGASQPLFFGGREDMTCPPATRGLDPGPGEPTTIPVSSRRASEGNGRADSSRR